MVSRKRARNASIISGAVVFAISYFAFSVFNLDPAMAAVLVGASTGIIAYAGMDPK